ncbi:MAG: 2-dehydro-3-deoxyphosphogluconate aldolase / (4S)-4-hydroxy-2-oxoglutarate aldolase [Gaiellaceae bacterium]|jgi:2-dehydro-3-deoxyphosphogluconate aldolase/(4S)-4-hydroxy-2-oxoglutarate aldolase|nr:2-dehydro-3-deoxyphosphogluconate aldolase / (4S)-4-hydroxy-2-oxoglutarate aldolase [Gaiellaceae bacterium]
MELGPAAQLRPDEADAVASLRSLGIVPVVELAAAGDAPFLIDALAAAGLPVVEVTLRTGAALLAIATLRRSHPDVLVGAGTVRSAADAGAVIEAGAQFVVSPGLDLEVIELCRNYGVLAMPGACTPTEVDAATRAGAKLVKFFPAEAIGGVAFLKALTAPFRDVSFVPTGGINASNLADYLRVPQVVACGGSWMVAPQLINERRFDRIEVLAREATAIVAEVRADA